MSRTIFKQSLALSAGLFMCGIVAGDGRWSRDDDSLLAFFYDYHRILAEESQRACANTLISHGLLQSVLVNGKFTDHVSGPLARYANAKPFVILCLTMADTVTAKKGIYTRDLFQSGILTCEGLQLVTVRDWKKCEWFAHITEINLAGNKLHEIPGSFYRMFPCLQVINLSGNPIEQLDTTSMPQGLQIIADHTNLKSIRSTNNLYCNGYIFSVKDTPLAHDSSALKLLTQACTQPHKGLITRLCEKCCGKNSDVEMAPVKSVIITQATTSS